MIPLHDDQPTRHVPVVTIGLIVLCTIVFLWQQSLGGEAEMTKLYQLGMIPAVLFGHDSLPPELRLVSAEVTLVTSMFLHGGWLHLIGNMLYLWIFGNNVEDAMGPVRFIVFYLLCGVGAALAQGWADPTSVIPMIGASGAIGGVLGAYLLLHPKARILVLILLGIFSRTIRVPAFVVLAIWFVLQFILGAVEPSSPEGGVAYWAHIGGFIAGAVLILLFKRRDVPLFDAGRRDDDGPWERRR